jgi:hypothetical protein
MPKLIPNWMGSSKRITQNHFSHLKDNLNAMKTINEFIDLTTEINHIYDHINNNKTNKKKINESLLERYINFAIKPDVLKTKYPLLLQYRDEAPGVPGGKVRPRSTLKYNSTEKKKILSVIGGAPTPLTKEDFPDYKKENVLQFIEIVIKTRDNVNSMNTYLIDSSKDWSAARVISFIKKNLKSGKDLPSDLIVYNTEVPALNKNLDPSLVAVNMVDGMGVVGGKPKSKSKPKSNVEYNSTKKTKKLLMKTGSPLQKN